MRYLTIAFIVAALGCSGGAHAQNLTPNDPDIVFECVANDKPAKNCQLSCGSELDQASGGKHVNFANVDRVEILNKGATGHVDTRAWLFVRARASEEGKPSVVALWIGPPIYCSFELERYIGENQSILSKLKITRFRFN